MNSVREREHVLDPPAETQASGKEIRDIKRVIGISYIWQGITSGLISTPMTFFIKEGLKLSDAWGQIFSGATSVGWLIKPLWGWISDTFPIRGEHRRPWFIAMALFAGVWWLTAAFGAHIGILAPLFFFLAFNMAAVGAAFVDVTSDAIMVENGQRLKKVSLFVNHQWTMLSLTSAIAGFVGGWLTGQVQAGNVGYSTIFAIAAVLPFVAAYFGWKMQEKPRQKKVCAETTNGECVPFIQRLKSVVVQNRLLIVLFLFMFFWHFNPSLGYIQRSYLIDHRGFTPEVFGIMAMLGGLVFFASLVCYRFVTRTLAKVGWHHWLYLMIALNLVAFPMNFFIYLEPDHAWWQFVNTMVPSWIVELPFLPDWNQYVWFTVLTGNILAFASIPAIMIPLQIAGGGINPASAGFQYALLMSTINLTHTIDDILGGAIYGWFSVENGAVTNSTGQWLLSLFRATPFEVAGSTDARTLILQLFIWVGVCCVLISAIFVMLVRRASKKQNVEMSLKEA